MLRSTRLLAVLFAAFMLMLGACGDDDDATDAGTTPDAQADGTVTPDATPDVPAEVAEEVIEDAVAEVAEDVEEEIVPDNFCLNATDGALLVDSEATCVEFVLDGDPPVPVGYTMGECDTITDDSEYLVDWLGDAVGHCAGSTPAQNPHTCIGCLTGPTTCFPASETDPDEYDLTSCVLECIELSAADATMPPIHDAVVDSGLSEDCAGCFAGITACILGNNCAGPCLTDSDSCACHECSCGLTDTDLGRDCADEFALCSGVDPYIDCADLESCE